MISLPGTLPWVCGRQPFSARKHYSVSGVRDRAQLFPDVGSPQFFLAIGVGVPAAVTNTRQRSALFPTCAVPFDPKKTDHGRGRRQTPRVLDGEPTSSNLVGRGREMFSPPRMIVSSTT